jgi:hypothetical protein
MADKEPKEILAKYDTDTKKTHRFLVEHNSLKITGGIYVSKEAVVPETVIVRFVK